MEKSRAKVNGYFRARGNGEKGGYLIVSAPSAVDCRTSVVLS